MTRIRIIVLFLIGAVVLFLWGCGQTPSGDSGSAAEPNVIPAQPETVAWISAYEGVRSLLVTDETQGLAEAFGKVEAPAREAAKTAASPAAKHLEDLADAAGRGREMPGEAQLNQARKAFGEMSRHLIAAIAAEPDLAVGRFVFECAMAKGYPKWVQASETVANPYMGAEMPSCGVKTDWSE